MCLIIRKSHVERVMRGVRDYAIQENFETIFSASLLRRHVVNVINLEITFLHQMLIVCKFLYNLNARNRQQYKK